MDWLLHYEGEYAGNANDGVRLKNGAAEAVVKILHPACALREESGLADHNPDKKIPYLAFRPGEPAQSRQFLTAICLNPDAMPQFEVLEDANSLGVSVHTKDAVEEFYLNLRAVNSPGTINMRVDDWVTDAYLLHLRRSTANGPVERYFIGDGSYLRRDSQSLMESLAKTTVCWSPGDPLEVYSGDESGLHLSLAAEKSPRSARLNGRTVTTNINKETMLVEFASAP